MYTEQDIEELWKSVYFYELEYSEVMNSKTNAELAKVCNGIGSDAMPEQLRNGLTIFLFRYQPAGFIHDADYEYKPVSKEEADLRFYENMLRIWKKDFGWKRWFTRMGRAERAEISACYAAVKFFGGSAWSAAKEDE